MSKLPDKTLVTLVFFLKTFTKIKTGVNWCYVFPPGLRTLCIAMAELEPEEFQRWSDIYYRASTSLENREQNVDEASELIEKVRCLVSYLCGKSSFLFSFVLFY